MKDTPNDLGGEFIAVNQVRLYPMATAEGRGHSPFELRTKSNRNKTGSLEKDGRRAGVVQ